MADHDWPASLPVFLVEGYGRGGHDDSVIRSKIGRASKQRPRFTTPMPEPVRAVLILNLAQLQTFLDFYNITLKRVLAFNLRDHTKPDLTPVEYRFTGTPAYEPAGSGQLYRVSMELEQLTTYQGTFPLNIEGLST